MSALGLAKDSVLDLAGLLHQESDELANKQNPPSRENGNLAGSVSLDSVSMEAVHDSLELLDTSHDENNIKDTEKEYSTENLAQLEKGKDPYPRPKTPPESIELPSPHWNGYVDDDYYDSYDPYSPQHIGMDGTTKLSSFLRCLFPWCKDRNENDKRQLPHNFGKFIQNDELVAASKQARMDMVSSNSDDSLAASALSLESATQNKAGKKGILRNNSSSTVSTNQDQNNSPSNLQVLSRRSLFTTKYSESLKSLNKVNQIQRKRKIQFSHMAKVTHIPSNKDMTIQFKSFIWWQKQDFEDFKKTARIIAKAMVTGGHEIWLQNGSFKSSDDHTEDPGHYAAQKWWCRFGHSRRGLEHIVNVEEGQQRQKNVSLSIKAVIDEQRQQRYQRRKMDDQRLACVSTQYTSWARDLALASGFADADAVVKNFSAKAKPRSYYLPPKHQKGSGSVEGRVNALTSALTASESSRTVLDENTKLR